jgi:hypothetical protein
MHQTTVRFGTDLWEALEEECARLGVSVAQFLREAALARMMYAAGRRGDDGLQIALNRVTGGYPVDPGEDPRSQEMNAAAAPAQSATSPQERAFLESSDAAALQAQSRLARRRAQELRARLAERRR